MADEAPAWRRRGVAQFFFDTLKKTKKTKQTLHEPPNQGVCRCTVRRHQQSAREWSIYCTHACSTAHPQARNKVHVVLHHREKKKKKKSHPYHTRKTPLRDIWQEKKKRKIPLDFLPFVFLTVRVCNCFVAVHTQSRYGRMRSTLGSENTKRRECGGTRVSTLTLAALAFLAENKADLFFLGFSNSSSEHLVFTASVDHRARS